MIRNIFKVYDCQKVYWIRRESESMDEDDMRRDLHNIISDVWTSRTRTPNISKLFGYYGN